MRLEDYMEFIESDERIEITPKSLRVRKAILSTVQRHKARKYAN